MDLRYKTNLFLKCSSKFLLGWRHSNDSGPWWNDFSKVMHFLFIEPLLNLSGRTLRSLKYYL